MEWYWALCLLLGGVMLLLLAGLPVAFAFLATNLVGVWLFQRGEIGLSLTPIEYVLSITKFELVPVALFILMGEILFHTGVAFKSINAVDRMISRVPGRLAIVATVAGTMFASLSGSSLANTAILGNVLLPDMLRRGYHPTLAMGPIMAVGGIAILIPPSSLAVLLASLAERSITDLLIAGILPGVLMSILFFAFIIVSCVLRPSLAPPSEKILLHGWERWRPFFVDILPLFVIFAVVVGSIFFRIAAPEEAAALGCLAAVGISVAYKKLTVASLMKALRETAKINVMLLFIITGSLTFAQSLQVSGATRGVLEVLTAMSMTQTMAMVMMMLLLLFLGCFMDQISMMLLTLPFFLPLADTLGMNSTWLLLMMLIAIEIGLLTPPFGLLLFVLKGVAPPRMRITQIYRAAFPFIALEILVVGVLITFPKLALWLPDLFR